MPLLRPIVATSALLLSACVSTGPARTDASPANAATSAPPTTAADVGDRDPHLRASAPSAPAIASPVAVPLDAVTLAALPREPVTASAHGHALHCDGIPLHALLQAAGAMPSEPLRGAQLARYVQIDAADGYRALYALAELDPTLGGRKVYLTDRCDGAALPADDGPLRLIAPGDARPARWVRQVKAITVIVAP
jgi:hypothetical protein